MRRHLWFASLQSYLVIDFEFNMMTMMMMRKSCCGVLDVMKNEMQFISEQIFDESIHDSSCICDEGRVGQNLT